MPNKTRVEMWSPQKPIRELSRLRDCRIILDSMIETQVEWTPYMTSSRALLNEHPRTAYIEGITCFDIVEVYLPKRTVRQLGFVQAIHRQAVDVYLDELRDFFAEWQEFRGHSPS
ncbi:uncharacterized protein LOC130805683 [Amaranthus tricolor]|uniref:uncharacterized protein LOC130805683 n=1 Tax=Amaranthus tricolor TaxID=29722 RepID=UPI0025840993|nr:uncharacterized protein LOC130805683 [Amaranthus tricolor]